MTHLGTASAFLLIPLLPPSLPIPKCINRAGHVKKRDVIDKFYCEKSTWRIPNVIPWELEYE